MHKINLSSGKTQFYFEVKFDAVRFLNKSYYSQEEFFCLSRGDGNSLNKIVKWIYLKKESIDICILYYSKNIREYCKIFIIKVQQEKILVVVNGKFSYQNQV